jgi:EAP30/Vps36 family
VYVLSEKGTREERYLRFSFRNGGRDESLTQLTKAIAAAAWKRAGEPPKRTPAVDRARHGVGISGLIRKAESESRERDDTLAEAFSSLESLMALAQPLVVLSRRLAAAADNGDEVAKHNELQVAMLQIGIANPVTK